MRRLISLLVALLAMGFLSGGGASPAAAQGGSASALISAVNQLRAANGLPALKVNAALMAIAQAQSDYQASIGSVTHTGPGGTRPRDRAVGAGYGGGATIYVSENIAGGTNLSVQQAISWWQGDAPHLSTMLGPNYQDVGAGVAASGDMAYYTLDVGYIAGSNGSGDTAGGTSSGQSAPVPAGLPLVPVQVATSGADGSILHVVRSGQAPLNISNAYEIPLADLLELNGLTEDSIIYPDDKLVIQPAFTPTATPSPTATPTPTRRPTRTPMNTPAPLEVAMLASTQAIAAEEAVSLEERTPVKFETEQGPLVVGIVLLAFIALATPLVIGLQRKT